MSAISNTATTRTAAARRKRRELQRPGWIQEIVGEARRIAGSLENASRAELQSHTDRLRRFLRTDRDAEETRVLVLAAAAMIEAIRQSLGMTLFDVQIHAGIIVARGAVAEMQTGEGKTLSVALPAYVQALAGRGVHVATPNSYLAKRDREKLSGAFHLLGMSTGLLQDNLPPEKTRAAYCADVTYGPGHAFGFDYLRDQLTLDRLGAAGLGAGFYQRMCGDRSQSELLQRGLFASIVDEVDHVLIDDAVSPLLLSGSGTGESPDAEVHHRARDVAEQLRKDCHFRIDRDGSVELTEDGFDQVYEASEMAIHPDLVRPWHQYVVLALRAMHVFDRDVHYVVREEEIQIVDTSTGRIFEDRTWSEGLHQAIEAREGLMISRETMPLARITRQRFYRYYQSLGGMTGTATGCEHEFASVYGLPVCVVPLRTPSKRILLDPHVSETFEEKLRAIGEETESIIAAGRAVLIGTLNIAESIQVAGELKSRGLKFELLNGVQDADEAAIVAQAGQPRAITVATNLAGRGTDIGLHANVARAGGLHVIVTQKHSLARVDRQLVGRCARCGDPGTARVFVSAEDTLVKDHAPWISRAIRRWHIRGGLANAGLEPRLRRVQENQQRLATSLRWQLLQSDQRDEKLLDKKSAGSAPDRCLQL